MKNSEPNIAHQVLGFLFRQPEADLPILNTHLLPSDFAQDPFEYVPIMLSMGTGSEVMQRIAAPMIGGMITAPLLSLFVLPVVYYQWKRRSIRRS